MWKFLLYANLKKCRFHQEEVWFLSYIVSLQSICMEDKTIKAVKQWLKLKSVRDILVFLGFANFYWQFIQDFSHIATPHFLMLRTTGSTRFVANPDEIEGEVNSDSIIGNLVCGNEATNPIKGKNQAKSTKSKILIKSKNHDFPKSMIEKAGTGFLTSKARQAFTQLRQAFVEAPILHHFDPKSHIQIETNVSGYVIGGVLSQLSFGTRSDEVPTKANLGQWLLIAFFSRKMIPAETWYKTYNGELLATVKAFKTWQHYLESCKHKVLVFTDNNNLCCFMDTKSPNCRQVRLAQKLSRYYFCINYWQDKAHRAANALLQYPQQNAKKETIF